jgi:predicted metal-dependent peptidase
MHLVFVEDKRIPTAATDGKTIWYNADFLSGMKPGERNFVLMHEFFHVLLRHGLRNADRKRDKDIWNIACDIIVNNMLMKLYAPMSRASIPFQSPSVGIFANINSDETAENLYAKIKADNADKNKYTRKLKIRKGYTGNGTYEQNIKEIEIPSDLRIFELSVDEVHINDQLLQEMIRTAVQKNRSTMDSYYIPPEIYGLVESKKLDWKRLLKEFLSQEIGDDSSYTTPERKYLHMDMILPGHSLTDETIEEVWAFVDSSGSIGQDVMAQFLTQLYRISREFKCVFNICYWDTAVTEVYKKILREDDILKCIPRHSGGTDINCVYRWIQDNKVKPDVMLILTDGYFGPLTTNAFHRQLGKKTILVLSSNIMINDDMKKIGKIAKL